MIYDTLKKERINIKGKSREFTLRKFTDVNFTICDRDGLVISEHRDEKKAKAEFKKYIKSLINKKKKNGKSNSNK